MLDLSPTRNTAMMATPTIFIDARCLQDDNYRLRGVGQHSSMVLAASREAFAPTGGVSLVAVLDRKMQDLSEEHASLFDSRHYSAYRELNADDWFLALSPMTHSPMFTARMLTRHAARSAAIVYDFIPHERPEIYLADRGSRIEYLNNLSWLKRFGVLLPISDHTGDCAVDLLGVGRSACTHLGSP